MFEDLLHILVAAVVILSGIIAFQQFRIARLHRKYEELLTSELVKAASRSESADAVRIAGADELMALRGRVQVLERIATDPSDRLGKELEALRSVG